MKILMASDFHIKTTAPEGRIDNFFEVQKGKWQYIFQTAKEEGVDIILQAGDLFDKPTPPYTLLVAFIHMIMETGIPFHCIYGQHDMMMRSTDIGRTALGLMKTVGMAEVLNTEGMWVVGSRKDSVRLFGMNFGDDYKELEKGLKKSSGEDCPKILVVHDMIGNEPLFPGHKITDAKKFLATWKEFDVILCGDYHYDFYEELDERVILNTGCLLRLSRTERDMKRHPHFYILDTQVLFKSPERLRKFYVPIKPWQNVFRIQEKPEVETVQLIEFIERLKTSEKVGISFLDNLNIYFEENNVRKEVKEIIEGVMENEYS